MKTIVLTKVSGSNVKIQARWLTHVRVFDTLAQLGSALNQDVLVVVDVPVLPNVRVRSSQEDAIRATLGKHAVGVKFRPIKKRQEAEAA